MSDGETALIVGVGRVLGAAVARLCAAEGMRVAVAARDIEKLKPLVDETGAKAYRCDAGIAEQVDALFGSVVADLGVPDFVVYNAAGRSDGPITELDPEAVANALKGLFFGGFLVARAAAREMVPRGSGTILFTGNQAALKPRAEAACTNMGKSALRGLAHGLARELGPKNIHVIHCICNGAIPRGPDDPRGAGKGPDALISPPEIARTYLALHHQHRSAWMWEAEIHPWSHDF